MLTDKKISYIKLEFFKLKYLMELYKKTTADEISLD
jgi:hypothetical protein